MYIVSKGTLINLSFMASFYGWVDCLKGTESHCNETVLFLPQSPQDILALIQLTLNGWKAESPLEPTSGSESETLGWGIHHSNN